MSRSAAGARAASGRNVAAKAGLNQSILDQGWAEFRRQLGYIKLEWGGGQLTLPPLQGFRGYQNKRTTGEYFCGAERKG